MSKECEVDGCERRARYRLCSAHRLAQPGRPQCSVQGCSLPRYARGWCSSHYYRWLRSGSLRSDTPVVRPQRPRGSGTVKNGYVLVKAPDSPMASRRGYVPEHRLVVASVIGRPLLPTETVHHVNGVRSDNRPENLELRSGQHGRGANVVCPSCGHRF